MEKLTKKKSLSDWDWTTLVAAWRYYEHRNTIASAMFPHEVIKRFFTGDYDEESCKLIARQFVEIDHRLGPDNKLDGWVGDDAFGASDRKAAICSTATLTESYRRSISAALKTSYAVSILYGSAPAKHWKWMYVSWNGTSGFPATA